MPAGPAVLIAESDEWTLAGPVRTREWNLTGPFAEGISYKIMFKRTLGWIGQRARPLGSAKRGSRAFG